MSTNRPLKVFLCHSSNDKPAVRELYQKLRAEPWIQPWLDEEELFPGMDWNMEIEKAIEATDVILVCLSNNSITKEGYVQREIRIALDYADYKPDGTLFIIPVRLEECVPPKRLARWQYADYFEGQRERGVERLLISLKKRGDLLGIRSVEINQDPVLSLFKDPDALFPTVSKLREEREIRSRSLKIIQNNAGVENESKKISKNLILANGMEFMRIPAGKFIMGSDDGEKDEVPKHIVEIPYDYWMARYPVTNILYNAFVESNGEIHPVSDWMSKKDHPVVNISWSDTKRYSLWLRMVVGRMPLDLTLRLPTEAEWEKAARGTDGYRYPWGDEPESIRLNALSKLNNVLDVMRKGIDDYSTSVTKYSPSGDTPYGCADMVGNVWEWTHSLYKEYPYRFNDGREKEKVIETEAHVLRGGSYLNYWEDIRCTKREKSAHRGRIDFGFRLCLAPPLPK